MLPLARESAEPEASAEETMSMGLHNGGGALLRKFLEIICARKACGLITVDVGLAWYGVCGRVVERECFWR